MTDSRLPPFVVVAPPLASEVLTMLAAATSSTALMPPVRWLTRSCAVPPQRVKARVRQEIGKDLAGLEIHPLTEHLAPDLWP